MKSLWVATLLGLMLCVVGCDEADMQSIDESVDEAGQAVDESTQDAVEAMKDAGESAEETAT